MQKKYNLIKSKEVRYEEINTENADIVIVAYGTCARICKEVLVKNKTPNIKVGLLRPITLWPYPSQVIQQIAGKVRAILTVEMSAGQMLEDVKLSVSGRCPVHFYGRTGGGIPSPKDIIRNITEIIPVKEKATCAT